MNAQAWEFESDSPESTLKLGAKIARSMRGGAMLGLVGPLGAGKTLLVRGIATENAGGPCEVSSPTFMLIQEYSGRFTVYHLDVYRLSKPNDPLLMGLDEMVRPDSVVIVEWAERVRHALGRDILWIEIAPIGESGRIFRFSPTGPIAEAMIESLREGRVDSAACRS